MGSNDVVFIMWLMSQMTMLDLGVLTCRARWRWCPCISGGEVHGETVTDGSGDDVDDVDDGGVGTIVGAARMSVSVHSDRRVWVRFRCYRCPLWWWWCHCVVRCVQHVFLVSHPFGSCCCRPLVVYLWVCEWFGLGFGCCLCVPPGRKNASSTSRFRYLLVWSSVTNSVTLGAVFVGISAAG